MRRFTLLLLSVIFTLNTYSQVFDNFSDGNFTLNPTWSGDVQKFIIEEQVLRLNDNQAGNSFLATPNQLLVNTNWEFWVRLAFTPSNNNHPRIYLASDNPTLSGPLNGYFIRIGKDGTDNKRIYFFRQTGNTITEIMAGSQNIATTTNNRIRIRVTRNEVGRWEFFADPAGGQLLVPQGNVTDNQHTSTQWFGFHCFYTVSNATNFYFDDFSIGQIVKDETPPHVTDLLVPTANTIELIFSEAINANDAQNIANYSVNGAIGNPVSAIRSPQQPNRVVLSFSQPFTQGQTYNLAVSGIRDLADNLMEPWSRAFYWFQPGKFDVVFSEIMANPNPSIGLPVHEYVELYNRSPFDINLQGWTLQHGSTQRILPKAIIPAGGYRVLATETAATLLAPFGNATGVPGLSATALTNAGTLLQLWDQNMELIAWVNYSYQWYKNASKANGGWSLEKIDLSNLCEETTNWRASIDTRGGTPGSINSIADANPDIKPPLLLRAGFESPTVVSLFFSESIDPILQGLSGSYSISNGIGNPTSVTMFPPEHKRVNLVLGQPLLPGVAYTVTITANFADCAGNAFSKNTARVGLPEAADSLDLVINEILFNPPELGERYVELFNRSTKVIDLQNLILASMDTIERVLTGVREISSSSRLLFPAEYVVITPNPNVVIGQFPTNDSETFITATLSAMTNSSGIVVLAGNGHNIIDRLIYVQTMHYPLLTDRKGISLERLNPERPTYDKANWHSASKSVGFGTPGLRNSQFTPNITPLSGTVELYPRIFSPDNDGFDDVLNISYKTGRNGFSANITVYDSRGRLVRTLYRSELLASEGILTWDGITNDYQKADMGIYIVFIEMFEPGGSVETFKKTAVLGGKLP